MKNNSNQQNFFDVEKNVLEYIEMCEGKDGEFLIDILKKHLPPNSTVLELGIGAGKDLDILNETYQITGSDYSQTFLDIYQQKKPTAELLLLDAITLETNRKFDCIYSNKVLHHLKREDLIKSLNLQKQLLNPQGILFHTFWYGDKNERFQDLNFVQYKIKELRNLVEKDYDVIEIDTYGEMNIDDSIYTILNRSKQSPGSE